MILNGLPWRQTEISVSFFRLHTSAAFWTLLFTVMATPFLLRDLGSSLCIHMNVFKDTLFSLKNVYIMLYTHMYLLVYT